MFTKINSQIVTIIVIYVDYLMIVGVKCLLINVEKELAYEFEMKALENLWYFIGLEVVKCLNGLLSRKKCKWWIWWKHLYGRLHTKMETNADVDEK